MWLLNSDFRIIVCRSGIYLTGIPDNNIPAVLILYERIQPRQESGETDCALRCCTSLVKAVFETLIDAGYEPEMAYPEVLPEV